jgi:hypothetical protein
LASQTMATWKEERKSLAPAPRSLLQRSAGTLSPVADVPRSVDEALRSSSQPLDAATRSFMEPRFGYDFSGVRVHSDGQSARSAGALAYTVGQDVVFQPGLYNPHSQPGRQLLAHELTHVIQQQSASSLQASRVGQPGDRYEQEADLVSRQVTQGKPAPLQRAGNVPQIQRQPDPNNPQIPTQSITKSVTVNAVERSECEAALADYLRKAQQEQGGQSLKVTPKVRTTLQRLVNLDDPRFSGSGSDPKRIDRGFRLDSVLKGPHTTKPEELAHEVAAILPDPCSAEALKILGKAPAGEPTPGKLERVKDVIEKSAPADKSEKEQQLEEQRGKTSQERFDEYMDDQRKRSGVEEKKYGPYSVDLFRLGRIVQGLPEALKGPKKKAQPAPVELPSEVYSAAGQLDKKLLTPPGGNPDDYADVQAVAEGLARELDSSQRAGQNQAVIDLGNTYNNVKDREPIFSGIRQIAEKMRQALPHHAAGVRSVNVVIGGQLVRVLPLAPIQSEEKK